MRPRSIARGIGLLMGTAVLAASCGGKVTFVETKSGVATGGGGGGGGGSSAIDCSHVSFVATGVCGVIGQSCSASGKLPDGRSVTAECGSPDSTTCQLIVDDMTACTCPPELIDPSNTCKSIASCGWTYTTSDDTVFCF